MLKSHTNKWVTHKLEGIYTPQRVSHRSESSEPPVRLSPGVQHQVDEPPEHLALRARRPPGLRKTEDSLLEGANKVSHRNSYLLKAWTRPACGSWRSPGEVVGSWLWLLPETQTLEAAMFGSSFRRELRTVGLRSQPILSVLRL